MPIYLYQCDACGLRFERLQRMSEEPLTECPECEGNVHRVIQPVGIIFKGSGFYVTDNRQGSSSTLTTPKEDKAKAETAKPAGEGESKETSSPPEKTDD
jgi:putative FmdB family regulatory protein